MSDPDFTVEGKEIHRHRTGRQIEKSSEFIADTPGGAGRFETEKFSGQQLIEFYQRMHGEILFGALASALQDKDTYFFATVNKNGAVNAADIFGSFHAMREYKLIGLNAIADAGPNGNNSDGRIQLEVYDYESQEALTEEILEIDFTDNKAFKRFNDIPLLLEGNKYGIRVKDITTADDVQDLTVQFVFQVHRPLADPCAQGVFSALATAKSNLCGDGPPTSDCAGKDGFSQGSFYVDCKGEALLCMDLLPCDCNGESGEECPPDCPTCEDDGCLQDSLLSPLATIKANLRGTRDPRITDDELGGYCQGSIWLNQVAGSVWMLTDATLNAAQWVRMDNLPFNKFSKAKLNLTATAVPTNTNDETEGYCVGSFWLIADTTGCPASVYMAVEVLVNSAVWVQIDNDLLASAKSNLTATVDPTPADNADLPGCYNVGSLWLNSTTPTLWMLMNFGSGGDANWLAVGPGLWQTDNTILTPVGSETVVAIEEVRVSHLRGLARSTDPIAPNAGEFIIWMSDGTATGDNGDILVSIRVGAVTKTLTLTDFSVLP